MSAETRRYWEALGAAFVSVSEPDGVMHGLLAAHDTVVSRPDRIVYAAGPAARERLMRDERLWMR